ncbi:MAG TPA: ketol-acid reductoisomerase [candidate division Zixibacteria bacterium]|nr:ketol-acid reductoisomerase [candidate division Zixibacteria bacterium]
MAGLAKHIAAVAVLGYGSQGRAIALNLRDSGWPVTVGLRTGSKSRRKAKKDGVEVTTVARATAGAGVVIMALPDHLQAGVFSDHIEANLKPGSLLLFLHATTIHFGLIKPPSNVDIALLAPHAPGQTVRERFLGERDISAFYAVHQDYSGRATRIVLALAEGIGFAQKRLVKTSFRDEAVGDLFGEQAVLCGGLTALIKAGFEILVAHGVPAENAYLEVVYQLDLIVALIKQHGITGMYDRISVTAQAGSAAAGPEIVDEHVRRKLEQLFKGIESGRFARDLAKLDDAGVKNLKDRLRQLTNPALEKAARKYSR